MTTVPANFEDLQIITDALTEVTLVVPDTELPRGGSAVVSTELRNGGSANLEGLTGRITLSSCPILPAQITMVMPGFWGEGVDETVSWSRSGDDLVGTYGGDGFPLPAGYEGHTDNDLTLGPLADIGSYRARTDILGYDRVLASDSWLLVVVAE